MPRRFKCVLPTYVFTEREENVFKKKKSALSGAMAMVIIQMVIFAFFSYQNISCV